MNKTKRSRPLLLEQLEDRSLFAASMMWFVSDDHQALATRDMHRSDTTTQAFAQQGQSTYVRGNEADQRFQWTPATKENSGDLLRSSHTSSMPRFIMAQEPVVVVPVFKVTFSPIQSVATISASDAGTSSQTVHSQVASIPPAQPAIGSSSNRSDGPPLNLSSTFANASNSHPEPAPLARREAGTPQAAPAIEMRRDQADEVYANALQAGSSQTSMSSPPSKDTLWDTNEANDPTILLVVPSSPSARYPERLEWIPDALDTKELSDTDEWQIPQPTLRELKALTQPCDQSTGPPELNRMPNWFKEQTGMIAFNAQIESPHVETVNTANVDVVLGAMMGVNRVITIASSVINQGQDSPVQAELLQAIDEALADKTPIVRETTRLSAMTYPAVALLASAFAAAKRYRGQGRMEHTEPIEDK